MEITGHVAREKGRILYAGLQDELFGDIHDRARVRSRRVLSRATGDTSLKETDYSPEGLRAMLLDRNKEVTARINDLKQQKKDEKITEEQFKEQAAEIKKDKNAPTVVIKGTDESSYKNLIDALDEMQICNISRYAIVDITDGDKFLLDNYEQKGELTRSIDR